MKGNHVFVWLWVILPCIPSLGQDARIQRLTDNKAGKPCIIVCEDGSRIAWIEEVERPAPENTVYLIKASNTDTQGVQELFLLPGMNSSLKAQCLMDGQIQSITGPHFKQSDLNYRIMGVLPKLGLSRDGRFLMLCVVEQYNTTVRSPFFIRLDLEEKTHELLCPVVPEALGTIGIQYPTAQFDSQHWAMNPAGTALAYALTSVDHRATAVVLWDLETGEARRLLGYETMYEDAHYDCPVDQSVLYGNRVMLGDRVATIAGRTSTGDGLWRIPLDGAPPSWIPAQYATPGIAAGDHLYYRSNQPATWLQTDGSVSTIFEQDADLDGQHVTPFWGEGPHAYTLDRDHQQIMQLSGQAAEPIVQTSALELPEHWGIRMSPTSSAASYQLVSGSGEVLVLPAQNQQNFHEMDLYVIKLNRAADTRAQADSGESEETGFESGIDQYEVGALLKPGELVPSWLNKKDLPKPHQTQVNMILSKLPAEWQDLEIAPAITPLTLPTGFADSAQGLHQQAQVILASQAKLDQKQQAQVINLLERANHLDPNNRQYRLDLAEGYLLANTQLSVSEAIDHYSVLLSRDRHDDEALARCADAYFQLGNVENAFALAYQRAVQNPDDSAIRFSAAQQIALLGIESGDLTGAQLMLRPLSAQYPHDSRLAGLIALVHQLQGEDVRAEAVYQHIIKTYPSDDPMVRLARQRRAAQ